MKAQAISKNPSQIQIVRGMPKAKKNSPLRNLLDQVPLEILDSLIQTQQHLQAPKVNPRVLSNQMVGYGSQKRASMKSMDEASVMDQRKSPIGNSNLQLLSGGQTIGAKGDMMAMNHGIKHHSNCSSELKKSPIQQHRSPVFSQAAIQRFQQYGGGAPKSGLVPQNHAALQQATTNPFSTSSKPTSLSLQNQYGAMMLQQNLSNNTTPLPTFKTPQMTSKLDKGSCI